jgi:quercetin dioxygenase-like cupin family protein
MTGLKFADMPFETLRPGVQRRLAHTDHLMIAVIDFEDGPKAQPDPPHSHPHEQVTYVAEGEINFFLDGQPFQLSTGDVFLVPPGVPHTIQQLTPRVRLIDCFTPLREDFLR